MPLPKRIYLENYVYFITTDTFNRVPIFIIPRFTKALIENIKFYRKKYGFKFYGYSIMPCHLHALILPKQAKEISKIIGEIKNYTRKQILDNFKKNGIPNDFSFKCGVNCHCQFYPGKNSFDYIDHESVKDKHLKYIMNKSRFAGLSWDRAHDLRLHRDGSPLLTVESSQRNTTRKRKVNDIINILNTGHVWQTRFYDNIIRNGKDFREKLNYINGNAQKHSLIGNPEDYMYSSWQNYYSDNNSIIKIDKISL